MTRWPDAAERRVSTGALPSPDEVRAVLTDAYERYRTVDDGHVADYIPVLAEASPATFGMCVASVRGETFGVGDTTVEFSIQSVSKPFVFALVCHALGAEEARAQLGVNNTGLAFDSVMAIELNEHRAMNPLVNAGAITTTSLVPGRTADEKWEFILEGLSAFAGRPLAMDERVYESEAATNQRNRGMARLLDSYGQLPFDPDEATDVYTKQCSVNVCVTDLAVMGATLADGGINPVTGQRVIDEELCPRILAVMAANGLYERSGDWLYDIGLPGKSGVSGGIVTIAPGKGGLGTFSPPLDPAGNSVRGILATTHLSVALGLNLFASKPA